MLPLLALLAAIAVPPKPDLYVTDRAGVLSNTSALNEKLAQFERDTSDQILVYVDQRLPPETSIEEMASEAVRKWGVGQKGKDNGAVLFVFVADRKMRIEVGYGLEGVLTDAKSKGITSTIIKPEFQRGNYAAGIENGVDAMLATVKGEPYQGSGKTVAETSNQPSHKPATDFSTPAVICGLPLAFTGLVIWLMVRYGKKRPRSKTASSSSSSSSSWSSSDSSSSSSSSDSSSSSSDSSSSFSGGGGDSGGGGSSDSW